MAAARQKQVTVKLSPQQQQAAALLAEGKSVAEVAEQIGADLATITSWQESPYFVAEFNRRRREAWASAHDRLRALVPQALKALEQAVQGGDVRAAVEILKAVDLYGNVSAPRGAVEAELVMVDQAEAWATAELAKRGPLDVMARLARDDEKPELARKRYDELRAGVV